MGTSRRVFVTRNKNAQGFDEGQKAAQEGGTVAGRARRDLEVKSGRRVITSENYVEQSEVVKRLEKKKQKE